MTKLHALIAASIGLTIAGPVAATEIYRCGPNGAVYSQTPCGEGRRVELMDGRSDEQRLQAQQVNERTVALASSLERDRLSSEAAHQPALAGSFSAQTKKASNTASRSNVKAKAKKRRHLLAQAANRGLPKSEEGAVTAPPRN
jgi:hypothetical protein